MGVIFLKRYTKHVPMKFIAFFLTIIFTYAGFAQNDTLHYPEEVHFENVRQLTFGGDNAEAYWSYDGKYIVFQRTSPKDGIKCDQIFIGKVPEKPGDKFEYRPVSSGKGRTTCPFFTKDGKYIIYASTHLSVDSCPPV